MKFREKRYYITNQICHFLRNKRIIRKYDRIGSHKLMLTDGPRNSEFAQKCKYRNKGEQFEIRKRRTKGGKSTLQFYQLWNGKLLKISEYLIKSSMSGKKQNR